MFRTGIVYAIIFSQQSSDNEAALKRLEEQVRVLEASVLKPLSGCTEVPPALKSAVNNLEELVS